MSGWFEKKLNRYNAQGIDEASIDNDLLSRNNPFLGGVADLEEFVAVRIGIEKPSELEVEIDGSSDDHTDVSS